MAALVRSVGMRQEAPVEAALSALQASDSYQELKFAVFDLVLERLEVRGLTVDALSHSQLTEEIRQAMMLVTPRDGVALNAAERAQLVSDVMNEIVGLGPLEPLLKDPSIDDIIVNGPYRVFVERGGQLAPVATRFRDEAHLMNIVQRIVAPIGRRIDEASPYVDARLSDGSRVNVVIPPIALDGTAVSIRKFRQQAFTAADYVRTGSLSREMLKFLATAVQSRFNIL